MWFTYAGVVFEHIRKINRKLLFKKISKKSYTDVVGDRKAKACCPGFKRDGVMEWHGYQDKVYRARVPRP